MSTYYYFHCTKHQQSGGLFARQAWGFGNADLIDSFKFVMHHIDQCGAESIGMHSERDDDAYTPTNFDTEGGCRREFLEQTAHIFPRSADWAFMAGIPEGEDHKAAWVEQQLRELNSPADGGSE